jgi:tetratricopeptide (TPR) repeat protein
MNRGIQTSQYRRHCFGLLATLSLSVLSIQTGWAQTLNEVATPVLQPIVEAERALQQDELQWAESLYRTALLEGWLLLGAVETAQGNLEAAQAAYETAEVTAAETLRPRLFLASVHLMQGNASESILLLRKIIGRDQTNLRARRLLAQALAAGGQLGESVQELEELRVLYPEDLENIYLLGSAYLSQRKPEKAAEQFNELVNKHPLPQTYVLIGRTYRDFDQFERAREALNQALELDPQVRRGHYYLGTVEVYDRGQQGLEEAMAHFAAELEIAPEDPMSNLYLGMALVEERREEEAIPRLEIASRDPDNQRDALQYLGTAYLRSGRAEDAAKALRRGLEIAESVPAEGAADSLANYQLAQISKMHYQLGLALRRTGDEEGAAFHFQAAEKSKALEAEDSRDRLQRYLEDEQRERPRQTFGSPLESVAVAGLDDQGRQELGALLKYRMAQAYLNLGVMQAQAREFSRAGDLFQQATTLAPDLPQGQASLGVARFNSGQFDLAIEPLSAALEKAPDNEQLQRMLALAWLNADHYEEAAALLREDSARATDRSLQYAYGIALVRSGRAAEAEQVFSDLLAKNEDWAELHVILAQAFAQQDDFDAAIASLERAIALRPDVPEAHLTLGEIYMRQGELEEAEAELRAELRSDPHSLPALYILATTLDLAQRSEEAREVLEQLLGIAPRSSNARYLLGKMLLAEGKIEQAQIQLEAAARIAPQDSEIHYQLGLALQRQGRADEARQVFETYQRLKREDESGGD